MRTTGEVQQEGGWATIEFKLTDRSWTFPWSETIRSDDAQMNAMAIIARESAEDRDSISALLDRRVTTVMARARLRCELRSIALDLLGPCESDGLPTDIAEWIEVATESAVDAALETSMSALTQTLQSMVAGAPREVVYRLERAVIEHSTGFD